MSTKDDMIEESVARALYELEPFTSMGNRIPWEAVTILGRDRFERRARAAIEAHTAALSASGYVIVPREPTEAMLKAGEVPTREIHLGNGQTVRGLGLGATPWAIWPRMVAAALTPSPEQEKP